LANFNGKEHLRHIAISPQRLMIYLYSAHRAVIFAIAQLSCCCFRCVKQCRSPLRVW